MDCFRAGLLAGAVLAVSPAFAGPPEDAASIQSLLDARNPVDAEKRARAALEAAPAAESADGANLLRLLGDALYDQKKYADAEPVYRHALALREKTLGVDHADTAVSVTDLALTLKELKRYDDAEPLYRRAIAMREKVFGAEHWDVARSWFRLARMVDAKGDFAAAAKAMENAIRIGEKAKGETDPTIVSWISERAFQLHDAGDLAAAETAYRLVIARAPANEKTVLIARRGLGNLLRQTGKPDEAEAELRAALAGLEATLGTEDPEVAVTLDSLAGALLKAGKAGDAIAARARALGIREKLAGGGGALVEVLKAHGRFMMSAAEPAKAAAAFARVADLVVAESGRDSLAAADAFEDLSLARRGAGEMNSAENLLREAIAIRERHDALANADGVAALIRLAGFASDRDDVIAAEAGYKRAIALGEAALGPDDPLVAFALNFLGTIYFGQNRLDESELLLKRALAVMEKSGIKGSTAAAVRSSLSLLLAASQRYDEAIANLTAAAAAFAAEYGDDSLDVARVKANIGQLRERKGEYVVAEKELRDAMAVLGKSAAGREALSGATLSLAMALKGQGRFDEAATILADLLVERAAQWGEGDRQTVQVLSSLALVRAAQGNDAAAAALLEAHVAATERAANANARAAGAQLTGVIEDRAISAGAVYDHLARTYARLAEKNPAERDAFAQKAFLVSQRVIESQAAGALQQMASRQASGSGELARLLRRREDLVDAWRDADRRRTQMRTLDAGKRDAAAEKAQEAQLAETDASLRALDADVKARFPDYQSLQRPAPLDFSAVQAALGDDEVLLFYADLNRMNDEDFATYLWAVPKSGSPRWVKLDKATGQISGAVRHMRGLLGVGGDTRGAQKLGAGQQADRTGEVLTAGEEIYKVVLAPVADLIAGKNLVIVPSKKLANLPFQLLVSKTAPAGSTDRYRDARWIARDHAITVLPSVSALAALKNLPSGAADRAPYLAFANPLLAGRFGDDRRAFARSGCAPARQAETLVAAAELPEVSTLFRGAAADVAAVRALAPLPETTDEVCAVADALGVGVDALRLGADANETEIKAMSENGALEKARILHFATHGLVSGELQGLAEPAIVMTPPDAPSSANDGLLTASEVTTLRLDADWVILSACNTASGEGGGEALSGLARAFFYAGARALMVSHWPVNSEAAVSLVTKAAGEIARDPTVDRAEALRRAMVAEIDKGGRHADPANWAPFILVGAAR